MKPSLQFGSRTAALVAALLLAGVADAQQAGPAAPAAAPIVNKMTILNGSVPTVSYSVQNGSPHLEALAQTLQYTDNELNVATELQKLRLGIVKNEQTLDAARTSQQLGFGPISTPVSAACYTPPDSALKRALIPGLAQEATPAMAYQLINLREQVQTELLAEQTNAAAPAGAKPPAPNAAPTAPHARPAAARQAVPPQFATKLVNSSKPETTQELQTSLENQILAYQQEMAPRIRQLQQMQAQQLQMIGR